MIETNDLTKVYEGVLALDRLNLYVGPGDVFGFIGPNGAGKTTTIRILATLLEPTGGTATIDGHDVVNYPDRVRKLMGFMPDYYGVYEGITVWEYLDFFAAAYGIPRRSRGRVIEDVIELTDLKTLREKLVSELSKGMKQRLCLAKTLVHDPKVLLLDEPASGLDPRARIEFRALLKELRHMGKTVLISSHILKELADMCNAVGILDRGRLICAGSIDEIEKRMNPRRGVRLSVLGHPDKAVEVVKTFPFVVTGEVAGPLQVRFEVEGQPDIPAVVRKLAEVGIPITGIEEEKADLEQVFMQIARAGQGEAKPQAPPVEPA
jgi:ABC-2 type transport system ATP-binding protein